MDEPAQEDALLTRMRQNIYRVAAVAMMTVVCACAVADAPRNLLSVGYRCEDNTYLSAVHDRVTETATVNNAIVLKQVRTASGFGYEAPPYALRGKGDEITWTSGSAPPVRCAVVRG